MTFPTYPEAARVPPTSDRSLRWGLYVWVYTEWFLARPVASREAFATTLTTELVGGWLSFPLWPGDGFAANVLLALVAWAFVAPVLRGVARV